MSFGILSGDPSELGEMLSEMCIKREINDVETGSKAYYEQRIYGNNTVRELILRGMGSSNDDLIASSKLLLENMRVAIRQQNEFINNFSIQPDPDERNELKIVSKGWYNLLRRQLMLHYNILVTKLNGLDPEDRSLLLEIGEQIRVNTLLEMRIGRDSNARYPPAGN